MKELWSHIWTNTSGSLAPFCSASVFQIQPWCRDAGSSVCRAGGKSAGASQPRRLQSTCWPRGSRIALQQGKRCQAELKDILCTSREKKHILYCLGETGCDMQTGTYCQVNEVSAVWLGALHMDP